MKEKLKRIDGAVRGFCGEVTAEFRRTTWPERSELWQSTVVVLVFIVLLSFTVLVFDRAIQAFLHMIHA